MAYPDMTEYGLEDNEYTGSQVGSKDHWSVGDDLSSLSDEELDRRIGVLRGSFQQAQPVGEPAQKQDGSYGFWDRQSDKVAAATGNTPIEGQTLIEAVLPFVGSADRESELKQSNNLRMFVNGKALNEALDRYGDANDESLKGYKADSGSMMRDAAAQLNSSMKSLPFFIGDLYGAVADTFNINGRATGHLIDIARSGGMPDKYIEQAKEVSQGDPYKMYDFFQKKALTALRYEAKTAAAAAKRMSDNKQSVAGKIVGGTLDVLPTIEEFAVGGMAAGKIAKLANTARAGKIAESADALRKEANALKASTAVPASAEQAASAFGKVAKLEADAAKATAQAGKLLGRDAALQRLASQGGKAGWKARMQIGLDHAKYMIPIMGTEFTRRRYGELTSTSHEFDENGNIVIKEGDSAGTALAKAAVGGYGEAAIFSMPIGEAAFGWATPMIKRGLTAKFGQSAAKMYENYVNYGRLTGLRGQPAMLLQMDLNAIKDEAFGAGVKDAEYEGFQKSWDKLVNGTPVYGKDENGNVVEVGREPGLLSARGQLDMFVSMLGIMAVQGGKALHDARKAINTQNIKNDALLKTYFLKDTENADEILKQMAPEQKQMWRQLITARIKGKGFVLNEENLGKFCEDIGKRLGEKQEPLARQIAEAIQNDNYADWSQYAPEGTQGSFTVPFENGQVKWSRAVRTTGGIQHVVDELRDPQSGVTITKMLPTDARGSENGYIYEVRGPEGDVAHPMGVKDAVTLAKQMSAAVANRKAVRDVKADTIRQIQEENFGGVDVKVVATDADARKLTGRKDIGKGTKAFFNKNDGKVYYILDNISNPQELRMVMFHETGRHVGINKMIEDPVKRAEFLGNLTKSNDPVIRRHAEHLADMYGMTYEELVKNIDKFSYSGAKEGESDADRRMRNTVNYITNEVFAHIFNREGVPATNAEWEAHKKSVFGSFRRMFAGSGMKMEDAEAMYRGAMKKLADETGGEFNYELEVERAARLRREAEEERVMGKIDRALSPENMAKATEAMERSSDKAAERYVAKENARERGETARAEQAERSGARKDKAERERVKGEEVQSAFGPVFEKATRMKIRDRNRWDKFLAEANGDEAEAVRMWEADQQKKTEARVAEKNDEAEKKRVEQGLKELAELDRVKAEKKREEEKGKRMEFARQFAKLREEEDHEKRLAEAEAEELAAQAEENKWSKARAKSEADRIQKEFENSLQHKNEIAKALKAARAEHEAKLQAARDKADFDAYAKEVEDFKRKEADAAADIARRHREELDKAIAEIEAEEAAQEKVENDRKSVEGAKKKAEQKAEMAEYERKEKARKAREKAEEEAPKDIPDITVETSGKTRGKPNRKVVLEYRGKNKVNQVGVTEVVDRNGNRLGWDFRTDKGELITSIPDARHTASSKKMTIGDAWKAAQGALERKFGKPKDDVDVVAKSIDKAVSESPVTEPAKAEEKKTVDDKPAEEKSEEVKEPEESKVFNGRKTKEISEGTDALDGMDLSEGADDIDFGDIPDFDDLIPGGGETGGLADLDPKMQFFNADEALMDDARAEGNKRMINLIWGMRNRNEITDFSSFVDRMAKENMPFLKAHKDDLKGVWNYASALSEGRVPRVGEVAAKDAVESAVSGKNVRDINDVNVLSAIERDTDITMVPAKDINGSDDRIPNLKRYANSRTGIEKELAGRPRSLLSKPIVAVEFEDGELHVATGRHRRDLYARHDMDIPVRILREKDGWVTKKEDGSYDLSKIRAIDALDNIQDGKGRIEDYVEFFKEYPLERDVAEREGFLGSKEARYAYALAKDAIPDVRAAVNYDGGKKKGYVSAEQAGAIADAAPRGEKKYNEAVQRAVLRDVLNDPSMDATDISIDANEAANDARRQLDASQYEQGVFDFGSGNPIEEERMAALRKRRMDLIRKHIAEANRLAADIRAAKNSNNGLTIKREDMRALGINERNVAKGGADRKRELEKAAANAQMKALEWSSSVLIEENRAIIEREMAAQDDALRAEEDRAFKRWCIEKGKKPSDAMRAQYDFETKGIISKAEPPPEMDVVPKDAEGQGILFFNSAEDVPDKHRNYLEGMMKKFIARKLPFGSFLTNMDGMKPGYLKAIGPAVADIWNKIKDRNGVALAGPNEYNDFINRTGGKNGTSGLGGGSLPAGGGSKPGAGGPGADVQPGTAGGTGGDVGGRPEIKGPGIRDTEGVPGVSPKADGAGEEGSGVGSGSGGGPKPVQGDEGLLKDQYHPAKFKVDGMKASDSLLKESDAMHYTPPPDIDGAKHLALPEDVIKGGKLQEHQLEPIAYADRIHDEVMPNGQRKAIVYGHGAGSGKGRMIAGTILNNAMKGRKRALWFTATRKLRGDVERDLGAFGLEKGLFDIGSAKSFPSEGVGFGSYDDIKRPGFVDNLVKMLGSDFDGVIAFDESHKAKTPYRQDKSGNEDGLTQKAVIELQDKLPKARVVYSSATFAQGIENLGYATRLGLWGDGTKFKDFEAFKKAFSRKGVYGMEQTSQSLKRRGQYFACQLSDKGVQNGYLNVETTPRQKAAYNSYNAAVRRIFKGINDALLDMDGASGANNMSKSPAWSSIAGMQQRMHNSMFSAMKLPMAIESAKKDIAEGRIPVFSLVFTNEAGAGREVDKAAGRGEVVEMDEANFGPKEILRDFLTNAKRKNVGGVEFEDTQFPTYSVEVDPISGELMAIQNQEAVRIRDGLLKMVDQLPDEFGNPINMIMDAFGKENVANMTGLNKDGFDAHYQDFKDGKRKVVVFSKVAGTGFTFSDDKKYKLEGQRVMYPLQPGWRADDFEQFLGRVHRNNQRTLPKYFLVSTDIPGERRFVSTVARRNSEMNAFSKGDRFGGSDLIGADMNFEDQYAKTAIMQVIQHLIDTERADAFGEKMNYVKETQYGTINGLLGLDKKTNAIIPNNGIKPGQFLNRMMLLNEGVQERLNTALDSFRRQAIKQAIEDGTYDPGLQSSGSIRDEIMESVDLAPDMKVQHVNSWFKTNKKTYDEFMKEHEGEILRFVKDKVTGEVLAVRNNGTKGRSRLPAVDVYGVDGSCSRDYERAYAGGEGSRFEAIPDAQAKAAWDAEHGLIPEERATDYFYTNGDLFNHWDTIGGDVVPHTYIVGRGEKDGFVGVPFDAKSLVKILKSYAVDPVKGKGMIISSVVRQVLNNRAVELKDGWTLKGVPKDGKQMFMVRGFDNVNAAKNAAMLLNSKLGKDGLSFTPDKKRVFFDADAGKLTRMIEEFPAVVYDADKKKIGDTGSMFFYNPEEDVNAENYRSRYPYKLVFDGAVYNHTNGHVRIETSGWSLKKAIRNAFYRLTENGGRRKDAWLKLREIVSTDGSVYKVRDFGIIDGDKTAVGNAKSIASYGREFRDYTYGRENGGSNNGSKLPPVGGTGAVQGDKTRASLGERAVPDVVGRQSVGNASGGKVGAGDADKAKKVKYIQDELALFKFDSNEEYQEWLKSKGKTDSKTMRMAFLKKKRNENPDWDPEGPDGGGKAPRPSMGDDVGYSPREESGMTNADAFDIKTSHAEIADNNRLQFFNIDEEAAERIGAKGYDDAVNMLRAGYDRRKVWEKTGWWKGKDGKMRYEIKGVSDTEFNEMADAIRKSGRFFDKDRENGSINSYAFTFADLEKELEAQGKSLPQSVQTMLEAYPKLGEQRIVLDYKHPKTPAEIATLGYSSKKEIRLYKGGMDAGTFNHEVQHKMQEYGGMGRGTNPTAAGSFNRYQKEHGEWEARLASARAKLSEEDLKKQAPWETKEEAGIKEDETLIGRRNQSLIRKDGTRVVEKKDPLANSTRSLEDKYHTNLTDRYFPWLDLERKLGRGKDEIYREDSPYNALRLLHGFQERDRKRYEDIWKNPFVKMLKDDGITSDQVGRYMMAMDVEARNAKVKARNGTLDGSGVSNEEAQAMIEQLKHDLGPTKFAAIEKAAKHLWDMQAEGLKRRLDSGRLDRATYEKWIKEEPFHVPMRDDYSEEGEPNYSTRQWKKMEFKSAEGRSSVANDVVEFMLKEYQEAMYGSNENEARAKIGAWVAAHPNIGQVKKGVRKGKGWSFTHGQLEDFPDPYYHEQRVKGGAGKPNLVAFKRNGNLMMIDLNGQLGERLAASVLGRDVKHAHSLLQKVMRPYASTATELSPTFVGRNAAADAIEATINTMADQGFIKGGKLFGKIIYNAVAMAPTIWKYNRTGKIEGKYADVLRRYLDSGASIGGVGNEGVSELRTEFEKVRDGKTGVIGMLKTVGRAISNYNRQVEYTVRMSVFDNELKAGKSDGEAAMRSREYTTDFNKYGNQRWMNSVWMFSNSVIGSAVRQVASMRHGKRAAEMIAGVFAYGVMESLLEHFYNADDDEKARKEGKASGDTMTEYNRANSLYFRMGDKYARLPFHAGPFSWLKYAGNVVTRYALGDIDAKEASSNLADNAEGIVMHFTGTGNDGPNIKQSLFPTLLLPFYQHGSNEDFAGRPIKRMMFSKTKPYSENGRQNTGSGYKSVARWLNEISGGNETRRGSIDIAPETLEFIVSSALKNVGRDATRVYDFVNDAVNGEIKSEHTPFASDFNRTVADNTQLYNNAKKAYETEMADKDIPNNQREFKEIGDAIKRINELHHWVNGEKKVNGKYKKTFTPNEDTVRKYNDIMLKEQQKVIDTMKKWSEKQKGR